MFDFHAIQEFGSAIKKMPAALSSCDGMDDDLTAIATWAEIFDDTAKLTSYCGWHYTEYQDEVDADVKALEASWNAKKPEQAGEDLATLLKVEIGPLGSEEDLEILA